MVGTYYTEEKSSTHNLDSNADIEEVGKGKCAQLVSNVKLRYKRITHINVNQQNYHALCGLF